MIDNQWYNHYPVFREVFMQATASAATLFSDIFQNPLVQRFIVPLIQYFLSPVIAVALFYWILRKTFDLGALNTKINTAVKDIEDLKKDGKTLLNNVAILKTYAVNTGGLSAGLFSPGSPLKLLPGGIKILNASGFKKIFEDNKTWFIDQIKKDDVKTLSDIDEAAFKVMEKCRDDNKYANYKELAFQNGVSLDILLRVLSIYLREEVAKEILK